MDRARVVFAATRRVGAAEGGAGSFPAGSPSLTRGLWVTVFDPGRVAGLSGRRFVGMDGVWWHRSLRV